MSKSRSTPFITSAGRFYSNRPRLIAALLALLGTIPSGCIPLSQRGPARSAVTRASAAEELTRLSNSPTPAPRPIVVLSGYHTLAIHAAPLAARIAKATCGNSDDV